MKNKAVVLLSGGLDSAVTLYTAKSKGLECFCLIFDYGQRHKKEIRAAKKVAVAAGCKYEVIKIALPWKGSALLDKKINIPGKISKGGKIPATYVPARNIIFLSFALSYAEALNARAIFIGAHAQDYSGYPDCRPEFYRAFDKVAAVGTKSGVEKRKIKIETPLINDTKAGIIRRGAKLNVPFRLTWSCYRGGRAPCGKCDSCHYRAKGFKEAGINEG
jgi:7-cyano-7-deazaguanine synthase